MAPASLQPSQPLVLVTELPFAVTLTRLVQTTGWAAPPSGAGGAGDRKSTRLNSSHLGISYAVFCLKKKNKQGLNIEWTIREERPLLIAGVSLMLRSENSVEAQS